MRDALLHLAHNAQGLSGLAIFLDRGEEGVKTVLLRAAEPLAPSKSRACGRTRANAARILARKVAAYWLASWERAQ